VNKIYSLRNKGHRITNQREVILQNLKHTPQTVETIHKSLKEKVDLASVYRTLDLFVKNNMVREIDFGDGKKRFELISQEKHHHHAVCNNCGIVEDITISNEEKILQLVDQQSNFQIQNHSLEFFGLCTNCQSTI